jgi:hypothetical protein
MQVFVTVMVRYGRVGDHSYLLDVFSDADKAMAAGQVERLWRGGKYEPVVETFTVDGNAWDVIDPPFEGQDSKMAAMRNPIRFLFASLPERLGLTDIKLLKRGEPPDGEPGVLADFGGPSPDRSSAGPAQT